MWTITMTSKLNTVIWITQIVNLTLQSSTNITYEKQTYEIYCMTFHRDRRCSSSPFCNLKNIPQLFLSISWWLQDTLTTRIYEISSSLTADDAFNAQWEWIKSSAGHSSAEESVVLSGAMNVMSPWLKRSFTVRWRSDGGVYRQSFGMEEFAGWLWFDYKGEGCWCSAGGEIEMKRMLGVLTMFELMWLAADWSKLVYMELTVNGHLAVTVYQSRLEDQYGWRSHLLDCQDHSLCLR